MRHRIGLASQSERDRASQCNDVVRRTLDRWRAPLLVFFWCALSPSARNSRGSQVSDSDSGLNFKFVPSNKKNVGTIRWRHRTLSSSLFFYCIKIIICFIYIFPTSKTTSSAIAETPRCKVGQFWPKWRTIF